MARPTEKTTQGLQYTMIVNYTTSYLEDFPFCSMTDPVIPPELLKLFSRMGFPHKILMDRGINFLSLLMHELCSLLKVKSLENLSVPHTDGLASDLIRL